MSAGAAPASLSRRTACFRINKDYGFMRTLFLQAPSFDGFDGGAGSRYQAKREIKSFWYPTWLAQPAALVPNSRLLDAPAEYMSVQETLAIAREYDLIIIHTSTPSFPTDARFAELLK